jgi:hypothetical protein
MTKPISAAAEGLDAHYKVRVVVSGAILHLASKTEPVNWMTTGRGRAYSITPEWTADWITDHRYGDTIGFIDWSKVQAITWRWCE